MNEVQTHVNSSIVAVYPDHDAAERSVRQLHEAGIPMSDLSIIGRGSQTTEEPVGFVSAGDYASAGAATGAWLGGLLGLCVGAAFLVLPGIGPIVVAGPLSAALLAGIEGASRGRRSAAWAVHLWVGACPRTKRSSTRRMSRGASSSWSSGASPNSFRASKACSRTSRPRTSISTIRWGLEVNTTANDPRQQFFVRICHRMLKRPGKD